MKQGVLCKYCQPYETNNNIYCNFLKMNIEGYKCDKAHCQHHQFEHTVFVGIGRCDDCPFVTISRTPRAGYAYDYYCTANPEEKKCIASYVEYDSEIPPVPQWCPFRAKEED